MSWNVACPDFFDYIEYGLAVAIQVGRDNCVTVHKRLIVRRRVNIAYCVLRKHASQYGRSRFNNRRFRLGAVEHKF